MTQAPVLTDRTALLRNRARATQRGMFLQEAAADELQERLELVNRTFTSPAVVSGFPDVWRRVFPQAKHVADDEILDLQEGAHDLILHGLCLHWANDPVGQLVQCRRALKPDGLFLGILFGGRTLHELRAALAQAETALTGGLSPRVVPMAEIRDLGALLQRAGFALPVADAAPVNTSYQTALHLMADLRAMGEGNALDQRLRQPAKRALFTETARIYETAFANADGRVPATFEMIVLTGWAPDESQQKPLRPGSAAARLAEALDTDEFKLPDTAPVRRD